MTAVVCFVLGANIAGVIVALISTMAIKRTVAQRDRAQAEADRLRGDLAAAAVALDHQRAAAEWKASWQ